MLWFVRPLGFGEFAQVETSARCVQGARLVGENAVDVVDILCVATM